MKHEYSSDELRELKSIYDESEAEITKLRTSALDIANLVVNYFDADIIKADINKPSNQQGA